MAQYADLLHLLKEQNGNTDHGPAEVRSPKRPSRSAHYDGAIHNWFAKGHGDLRLSAGPTTVLRYGENPHQNGRLPR
jgi:phosphoribosylaminoimidazolecarboxamide formyltransferase/IMP cyclohydrolase